MVGVRSLELLHSANVNVISGVVMHRKLREESEPERNNNGDSFLLGVLPLATCQVDFMKRRKMA